MATPSLAPPLASPPPVIGETSCPPHPPPPPPLNPISDVFAVMSPKDGFCAITLGRGPAPSAPCFDPVFQPCTSPFTALSFFFFKPLSTPFSRRTSQYFFPPRSRVRPRSSAAVASQRRCGASRLLKQPSLSLSLQALLYNDIIKSTLAFNPPPSPLNLPLVERLCNVDLGIPAARVGIELSYFASRSPPCCVVLCAVLARAMAKHRVCLPVACCRA